MSMALSTSPIKEVDRGCHQPGHGATRRDQRRGTDGRFDQDDGDRGGLGFPGQAAREQGRREAQPAAGQSLAQQRLGPGQPAGQRAFGDPQLERGFLPGEQLELAEQHRAS